MKVAFLLGSLNRGGLETLMLDVFRNASENNLDAIGIYRKTGHYENDFLATGAPMFKIRPRSVLDFNHLLKLRKSLLQNHIQVVHSQTAIDSFIAYLATRFTGIKLVTTFHSYCLFKNNQRAALTRFVINHSDLNLFVSIQQRLSYLKHFKVQDAGRNQVLYNGINFKKLDAESPAMLPVHLHSGTSGQKTLILGSVGNFNHVRDQMTICRFLKLLKGNGVSFTFYFVGAKSDSEPWRYDTCVQYCHDNGLSDCVYFMGSRNDVPQILRQLDAFIYSSNHDTFGIAVIEAIAAGIPVFVNDWEVIKEITEDGNLANLYKSKDENDLLEIFSHFLIKKDAYYEKAKVASSLVSQKYSIRNYIKNLNSIYNLLQI